MFIKYPTKKPKKKLEERIIIKLPGKEKVKNKIENIKYIINDKVKLLFIIKSNWNKKLCIKSII